MFKTADCTLMWRVIFLLLVILFLINLTKANKSFQAETFYAQTNGYGGTTESSSSGTLLCAKSCCYSGWPASVDLNESAFGVKSGDMGKKYRATNLKCNNGFTTGCVCDSI